MGGIMGMGERPTLAKINHVLIRVCTWIHPRNSQDIHILICYMGFIQVSMVKQNSIIWIMMRIHQISIKNISPRSPHDICSLGIPGYPWVSLGSLPLNDQLRGIPRDIVPLRHHQAFSEAGRVNSFAVRFLGDRMHQHQLATTGGVP